MSVEGWNAERLLLKTATTLLAEQRREDSESFNLFTVLRSRSDEVNLHSRFLHALLDHQTHGRRKNLAAFLKLECLELNEEVAIDSENAEVHREKRDFDLLINDSKCALVIENKIYAGDQKRQLHRYYYDPWLKDYQRHVVYLTLDGHEPTANSKGCVPDRHLSRVSYVDLLPWLETCHELASDDPALRSAIAQYRQLVRELTGGGLGVKQMIEMKDIIRESGSLALARHLGTAADELFVDIVHELWEAIDAAVQEEFKDEGVSRGVPSAIDCERIRQTFGLSDRKRSVTGWHGLYYPFRQQKNGHGLAPAPALGIEIDGDRCFFFGIRCLREDTEESTAVKEAYGAITTAVSTSPRLAGEFVRDEHPWWPCWRYVLGDPGLLTYEEAMKFGDSKEQQTLAKRIADQCKELWNHLKKDEGTRDLFRVP